MIQIDNIYDTSIPATMYLGTSMLLKQFRVVLLVLVVLVGTSIPSGTVHVLPKFDFACKIVFFLSYIVKNREAHDSKNHCRSEWNGGSCLANVKEV